MQYINKRGFNIFIDVKRITNPLLLTDKKKEKKKRRLRRAQINIKSVNLTETNRNYNVNIDPMHRNEAKIRLLLL